MKYLLAVLLSLAIWSAGPFVNRLFYGSQIDASMEQIKRVENPALAVTYSTADLSPLVYASQGFLITGLWLLVLRKPKTNHEKTTHP